MNKNYASILASRKMARHEDQAVRCHWCKTVVPKTEAVFIAGYSKKRWKCGNCMKK